MVFHGRFNGDLLLLQGDVSFAIMGEGESMEKTTRIIIMIHLKYDTSN